MSPLSPSGEGYRRCPINTGLLILGAVGLRGQRGRRVVDPSEIKVRLGQKLTHRIT